MPWQQFRIAFVYTVVDLVFGYRVAETMVDHLFEKIVAGDIPSSKIYEDDLVYSFLDINPLSPGHALVIPKIKYEFLHEVPEETSAAIGRVLPKIAKAIMTATGSSEYNILQNNGKGAHQARCCCELYLLQGLSCICLV
eukprot:TRINITY_DN23604_c0_g1_i1.p2 TRINITY_DN23604_c0_g1~~TRINITY_DN23604_c0_g1_i1.p2  ORF type:complete len:146 (+),score=28.11 TRINITY_DN23604_c0_g1_i1:24-440(+)